MSHDSAAPPNHKWQRAMKIARGKPVDDEEQRLGENHQHAEDTSKRRTALSLDDTERQIRSFFERL